MKQRIISAGIGLVILAVVIFFFDTVLLNVVISAIAALAVFELFNAINTLKYKGMAAVLATFAVVLPFALMPHVRRYMPIYVFVVLIAFFALILKNHDEIPFEKAAAMLIISIMIPLFFSFAVYLRDNEGKIVGIYYLLLALGSAWLSDTGAYFVGSWLGKRKLAPTISPKKTVEGAIGGMVFALILNVALAILYKLIVGLLGFSININLLVVALATPILSVLGIIGDLFASVIKRQNNVKDYGHIMPGHGGIMDRFDSVLLTLPAVYILTMFVSIAV